MGGARLLAALAALIGIAAMSITVPAQAQASGPDHPQSLDPSGVLESFSSNSFNTGETNGFFSKLGSNGRACSTCHVETDGWSFTPRHAQRLASDDPLFSPVDGADCPPLSSAQRPNSERSSMVLRYSVIRVQIAIPAGADFSLAAATNPKKCAIPPGSPAISGQLFLFRRPLPSTNLMLLSAVMWDGRETLQKITTQAGGQDISALLFDLADQANSATTGHAQGAPIAGTQSQQDVVSFEAALSTAQKDLLPPTGIALLDERGANGGAYYLQDSMRPAFFVGVNDPLNPPFTNTIFTIYSAWEPTSPQYRRLAPIEQAIGRGEAIFNNKRFVVHDVPGLNSVPSDPLYNSSDPLAGKDVVAGCGLCHNTPNVGNHSTSLPINIGVTMAHPTDNDGKANATLDLANLPVYTLRNAAGAAVKVTDPGKALISGKWVDIGKTKGPILRGLAARAPYFHNGSARDLATVVRFYNERFNIRLSSQEQSDLVEFLKAL
jgi:hypothetical protein